MNGLTFRQLSLLTSFPMLIALAIILGILILRKDAKYWGNRFFALTLLFYALALFLNLLYLFSNNSLEIAILNILSVNSVNAGMSSTLLGILIIYKGENEVIQNKITYYFIILIVIVMFIHSFIPNGVIVEFNVPKWSVTYGMYEIIFSQVIFLLTMYFSLKLYKELSPEMRRKSKRLILGLISINITLISISINNMKIIAGYESIAAILNLGALIGALLIYFGIFRR